MPKRSNSFQELVALLETALAPRGAKITESAMIRGGEGATPREIDVLIESQSGSYTMKVAVEAKDENRKMSIERFESIIAKYSSRSGIDVNLVVVVSRKGFTKEVMRRAKLEGIRLLTLKAALNANWAHAIPAKLIFSLMPHVARIQFVPAPPAAQLASLVSGGTLLCSCCGRFIGKPLQMAQAILRDAVVVDQVRTAASRANLPVCQLVTWSFPETTVLRSDDNVTHPVREMTAHIHASHARADVDKLYDHDEHVVQHLSADIPGTKVQLALPNSTSPHHVIVKFSPTMPLRTRAPARPIPAKPTRGVHSRIGELISRASYVFRGLDIRIEAGAEIHNYATGDEIPVDGAVYVYLNRSIRMRTAILVVPNAADVDKKCVRQWNERAVEAEIDRVLLLAEGAVSLTAAAAARETALVRIAETRLESDTSVVNMILPQLYSWTFYFTRFDGILFGPDNVPIDQGNDLLGVRIGSGTTLSVQQFYDRIISRVAPALRGTIVPRPLPPSFHTACDLHLGLRLPRGTQLLRSGDRGIAIGYVKAVASVRAGFDTLDNIAIVQESRHALKFSRIDASPDVCVIGGSLPRSFEFQITNRLSQETLGVATRTLSECIFDGLFGARADVDLYAENTCPHRIGKLSAACDSARGTIELITPSRAYRPAVA
jgi:hypothetical protein